MTSKVTCHSAIDPGLEKGHWRDKWRNVNQVCRLYKCCINVNNFDLCNVVM